MTNVRTLLAASALGAALLIGGCDDQPERADADDVRRDARELGESLGAYSAEQKDQAVAEAREAIAELNEQIEQVRARAAERWSKMDASAREKTEEQLEELEDEQAQLAVRFEALRNASGDAWARVREGFTEAYAELRDAWRETDEAVPE